MSNTTFDKAMGAVGSAPELLGPVGGLLSQRFGGNLGAAVTNSVLSGFANSSGGITTPGFGSQTQTALSQSTFIHLNLGHYYLGKKNHVLAEREFALAQAANSHDPKF